MKKIFLYILVLFLSKSMFGQGTITPYPIQQALANNSNALVISNAIRANTFIPFYLSDTTAWNNYSTYLKTYPFAIVATSSDSSLWSRWNGMWFKLGSAGGGATGSFWNLTGNYIPVTPSGLGIGTTDPYNSLSFKTNNQTRLTIPLGGILNSTASTDSVLVRKSDLTVGVIAKSALGGGGITSLNGLTGASQTFATGTSGTDFAISSSGTTHTFNIPDAGASARGLVTAGTQTIAGAKTFTSNVTVTGSYGGFYADATAGTYGGISLKNAVGTYGVINAYAGLSYFAPAAYPYHSFNADGGSGAEEIVNISNSLGSHIMAVSGRVLVSTNQNAGLNAGAITIQSTIAATANPGNNHRAVNDISSFRNPAASYAAFDDNGTIGNDTVKQGHHASFEIRLTKDKAAGLNEIRTLQVGQINAYGGLIDSIYGVITYDIDTLNGGRASGFWAIYDQYRTKSTNNYGAYFGNAVGIGRYQSHPDSLITVGDGGAWFKGGVRVSNLPAFADTTNYKPVVINSSGTLYKATYWPGGGGGSGITIGTTAITSGTDKRVLFDDAGVVGESAGFTYDKSINKLIITGTEADPASWSVFNSGASTTNTNAGIKVFTGSSGSLYGMNLGYFGGYGLNIVTGDGTSFFWTRGGGALIANFTRAMTLNTSDQLLVAGGIYAGSATTAPTAIVHIKAGTATASTAPLKLTTGTSLTTAEAGALEYTTPQLFFTNGGAQRQEIPQIQQSRVSTQFDKTSSTTLGNITDLTATVVAGKTYRFEAKLYTTSNSSGGVKVAIAGTATATAIVYEGLTTDAGLTTQSRGTAMAATVGAVTAVTAAYITITGTITVNAAGTLTCQMAQNSSNAAASSVLVGSTFVITEML